MQRNLLSFYKNLCLPSSFRKMSPSVGHLTMAWAILLLRNCGVFDYPQRGKCGFRTVFQS